MFHLSIQKNFFHTACLRSRMVLPLFLLNRLLSEGHVLHVFLESIERGVWFHTDTIVMIFGVPSARQKVKVNTHRLKSLNVGSIDKFRWMRRK